MIRFPYTLEMWHEEEATQDPETGAYAEGTVNEWRIVGKCNARQNGQARTVKGQDGSAFLYAYEVVMPSTTPPIAFNTRVRIYDRNGINIFDQEPRCEDSPDSSVSRSYPVKGFCRSGQPNQNVTIWL